MEIQLDFDGTVVEHHYPKIGRCNFGAFEVIRKLQDAGHKIILNTYRVECPDNSLQEALKVLNESSFMFFKDRSGDSELLPIKEYNLEKFNPAIWNWERMLNQNRIWIDDIAPEIPLKRAVMTNGWMVDWDELDKQFEANGLYIKI